MLDRSPSRDRNRDAKRELKRARDRRRYRRELAGLAVAPVEYSDAIVAYLVKYDWLKKEKENDRDAIGDAIARAMQDAAEADQK